MIICPEGETNVVNARDCYEQHHEGLGAAFLLYAEEVLVCVIGRTSEMYTTMHHEVQSHGITAQYWAHAYDRASWGIVLIVGHDRSVLALLVWLGLLAAITIASNAYDHLFVVVRKGKSPPTVLRLRWLNQAAWDWDIYAISIVWYPAAMFSAAAILLDLQTCPLNLFLVDVPYPLPRSFWLHPLLNLF
jgi:hypothetical protein